jgi:hypothetical protein
MKLLTEYINFDYSRDQIKESIEKNDGKLIMSGILQKSETVNQNGRVYPEDVLDREVRNYQMLINEGRALGELDHPDTSVVELKNVSHVVRSAHMDDGVVYGTIEVLNTPNGKILQSLVESGIKIGISSRGVGSTKNSGAHVMVQPDFQLICWDIVSEPSTPGAFVMKEGRDLTAAEIEQVNQYLGKDVRVDRIFNDILQWKNEE